MKKRKMVLVIDFVESHNPHHIEKCIRKAVGMKILPKFTYLMVGVDYKNLKSVNLPIMGEPDDE